MKLFTSFCFATILLLGCNDSKKKLDKETYEQTKESLADKEKNHPLTFLSVTGDNKKNLIGQTVIRGKITNTATVAMYKNIRIKMLCYTNDHLVEEHEDVIDVVLKPNSEKDFKSRYRLPKGTDSIALSVMSAEIATEKDSKK